MSPTGPHSRQAGGWVFGVVVARGAKVDSSLRLVHIAVAAAAVTVVCVAVPAQGATVWSTRPAPPVRATQLSCLSPTDCRAVRPAPANQTPIAERWDGVHWSVQRVPLPPGPQRGELLGLDCLRPSFCVA